MILLKQIKLGVVAILLVVLTGESAQAYVRGSSKWGGPRGTRVEITYSYSNLLDASFAPGISATQKRLATETALGMWARYAPLDFVEIPDFGGMPSASDSRYTAGPSHANLRIGHHYIDGNPDGPDTKAHAYLPTSVRSGIAGDVHFDDGDDFVLLTDALPKSDDPAFPFLVIMAHEIGHALGLYHSDKTPGQQAVMDASVQLFFDDLATADLKADDIAGIQAIYGQGVGSVRPIPEASSGLLLLLGGWGMLRRGVK